MYGHVSCIMYHVWCMVMHGYVLSVSCMMYGYVWYMVMYGVLSCTCIVMYMYCHESCMVMYCMSCIAMYCIVCHVWSCMMYYVLYVWSCTCIMHCIVMYYHTHFITFLTLLLSLPFLLPFLLHSHATWPWIPNWHSQKRPPLPSRSLIQPPRPLRSVSPRLCLQWDDSWILQIWPLFLSTPRHNADSS